MIDSIPGEHVNSSPAIAQPEFLAPDAIRTLFSNAMSAMYRAEVPQYGTLLGLVAEVNAQMLAAEPALGAQLARRGEMDRLALEYHGAIRLGTAQELHTMRRLFAVMGMQAVGYYDLSVAGVPVHSTAFRPVGEAALQRNPFRVFTSLLRLELIADPALRAEAAAILAARQIYTPQALALIAQCEQQGGLDPAQAAQFVSAALETFRWHQQATVSAATYERLNRAHRLIADVVCFKGPHINHLTPRTLDIDAVQAGMPLRGIAAKAVIEGPPRRACPLLLRQTSFKALQEAVAFCASADGADAGHSGAAGMHTARFGEVEQRGAALTPLGRRRYDAALEAARQQVPPAAAERDPAAYAAALASCSAALPDDWEALRRQGLAYFRYSASAAGIAAAQHAAVAQSLAQPVTPPDTPPGTLLTSLHTSPLTSLLTSLLERGYLHADPIIYEDFLPVSAAGIFQSNLGQASAEQYAQGSSRAAFEAALGGVALDELALYAGSEQVSLRHALGQLQLGADGVARCLAELASLSAPGAEPASEG